MKKDARFKNKRPTIKDVAENAGVSIATVSRVVNEIPGHYNSETKKRIVKTIESLNYRPNFIARSLRSSKTHTIGFVVPELQPFFAEILKGVQYVAKKKGYSIVLCDTDYDPRQEAAYVDSLLERRVDGGIFTSGMIQSEHILRLKEEGIPIVLIEKFIKDPDIPGVLIDNVSAAKKAVKYLIELGHRDIGFISAPVEIIPLKDRLEGYERALHENMIPYSSSNVHIKDNIGRESVRDGYQLMQRIIRQRNYPRAFFIVSDTLAIGAMKAIRDFGMKVPDDIAIVGFDDIEMASFCEPPLTTMAQPKYEMGVKGMELLIKEMSGVRLRKKEIELEVELVVRESCCAIHRIAKT